MYSSSDTRLTSFYMPEDLLTQILLNCPCKSVVRFQSVCKSWCSLIRSKSFTTTYNLLRSSSTPSWTANYLIVQNKQTQDVSLHHASDSGVHRRFWYPCSCEDGIEIVGAAYGAVMLKVMDGLIVWNPFDNKYTKIDIGWKHNKQYVYGMELDFDVYSNKCWGLKVIVSKSSYNGYNSTVYRLCTTRSFSPKQIQWNITKGITFQRCHFMDQNKYFTTNLNQACHWNAWRPTDLTRIIVAFDFRSEKFREILLPFKDWGFSMTAYKGMLCIGFFQVEENLVQGVLVPFHVNVMKEYGVEESWTSLLVVDIDPVLIPRLLGVTENEDVLIHIKKKKKKWQEGRDSVVSCNPHARPFTLLDAKFDLCREPEVCYGQSPLLF